MNSVLVTTKDDIINIYSAPPSQISVTPVQESLVLLAAGKPGPEGKQGIPGPQGDPGLIQEVIAGENISVDNSNPAYPVVSSTVIDPPVDSVNAKTGVVVLDTDDILDTPQHRYTNDDDINRLLTTTGINTGDQNLSGLVEKTTTVNGKALTSNITINASDVGLGNVNNTSDVNKPISLATQTALDSKLENITGLIEPGSNVIITGSGSDGDPYQISSTGGGGGTGAVNSVNGFDGDVILTTNDIEDTSTNRYTNDSDVSRLASTSGTNTGDQDLSYLVPNARTVNGHALSSNVTVTKTDVGLGSVDNTSDLSKPISTATQQALDLKADSSDLSDVALSGSYTDLLNKPTIPTQYNDEMAQDAVGSILTDTSTLDFTYNDAGNTISAAVLNSPLLGGQNSAYHLNRSNHTGTQTASTISDFNSSASASAPVQSVATKTGEVSLVKSDVGLGDVDNTSDAAKPVSTAQQTALNLKEDVSNKSTSTALGSSNTLYPSQNAVKTYVDTGLSAKENSFSKGSLIQGTNVTLTGSLTNRLVGTGDVTISASAGGTTNNYYTSYSSTEFTVSETDTDQTFTLPNANTVDYVFYAGRLLNTSEFSQTTTSLTVTLSGRNLVSGEKVAVMQRITSSSSTSYDYIDLKSPDGNIWRLTVNNTGNIVTTDI